MTIKRTDSGWLVDIQPGGRGEKRIRRTFPTKAEAMAFERKMMSGGPSAVPVRDARRLSDLVTTWYALHGCQLKERDRRRRLLESAVRAMGNPRAVQFTAEQFATYRAERLASGVSRNTVNHEHAYLRAVFGELGRLGEWRGPNPLAKLRALKLDERELSYLAVDQIALLLDELRRGRNPDTYRVAVLCLATGARWSEAETLRAENVGRDRVTYVGTKSGRSRTVPVDPELLSSICTRTSGRLFSRCYDGFRGAVERAGVQLPRGQLAHVLRHTFASHFVQQGGSILSLQRILGHASLAMTMRYAHLSPDHLEEARRLNPLVALTVR